MFGTGTPPTAAERADMSKRLFEFVQKVALQQPSVCPPQLLAACRMAAKRDASKLDTVSIDAKCQENRIHIPSVVQTTTTSMQVDSSLPLTKEPK